MSLAVAKGHTGIVRLLEEFESRQAGPSTQDLTLHPGHPTAEESVGEEARSGSLDDYQAAEKGWAREDVMGVEGADDVFTQDEPLGSRRDTKRPRGDEEDGLQHSVDDIAAPTSKRHRVGVPFSQGASFWVCLCGSTSPFSEELQGSWALLAIPLCNESDDIISFSIHRWCLLSTISYDLFL
ncbi:hypothetical protein BKA70DRAFT_1327030 [Coprinopsis sp. MPI-PUGE-AT-0042]|nr:hypothetical protein BKA70DRAFT_1327030 [Coprinopsis sp. MPI-PUGE-AT-0042]